MSKPIGQTFYISEPPPPNGVDGVFVTRIDVFFQRVSPTYGIELQLRTTENGLPTSTRMPFGTKYLPAANCSASSTASTPTSFFFDTPVFLPANKLYALVLVPAGGCPDYLVWTASISDTDVTTNTPIYVNNQTGDLFTSSNDLSWEPVYNEDMKFTLYIANFTATSGNAVFNSPSEEWIKYTDPVGTFSPREKIYFGNTVVQTATMQISAVSGTFNVGDTVYQGNSTTITTGLIYFANSTYIKVANSNGAFANTSGGSPILYNANSVSNCSVNVVSQYVTTTSASANIILPDASRFTNGDLIYVMSNNRSTTQIVQITQANTTTISNNFLTVNSAITFSDSVAQVGKLIANGAMYGFYSGGSKANTVYNMVLDSSTANSSINLGNSSFSNCLIIGSASKATGWIKSIYNPKYDTITPHFMTQVYSNTTMDWGLLGVHNDGSYTYDGAGGGQPISIKNNFINSFSDYKRLLMSRSNEIAKQTGGRIGLPSLVLSAAVTTQNTKISPVIDVLRSTATFTSNVLRNESELTGVYATYKVTTAKSAIAIGETITSTSWGNTATATVLAANSTVLTLYNVNGKFTNTTFSASGGANGYFTNVVDYGEAQANSVLYRSSRYISKNVILAANQDSEDIIAYLTAYRPSGTDLLVYAKILNAADNDPLSVKRWSRLPESTTPKVYSSSVNIDDPVELTYGFPQSVTLFSTGTNTLNNSTTVNVTSTQNLSNNSFIYIYDTSSKVFNVRKVIYVQNTNAVIVDRAPSANLTNVSLGLIPGIEHTQSAFLFDQGNNVVRYTTSSDMVYDRYIQFAIKIVPVGNSSLLIPRCADVRTICLQV